MAEPSAAVVPEILKIQIYSGRLPTGIRVGFVGYLTGKGIYQITEENKEIITEAVSVEMRLVSGFYGLLSVTDKEFWRYIAGLENVRIQGSMKLREENELEFTPEYEEVN